MDEKTVSVNYLISKENGLETATFSRPGMWNKEFKPLRSAVGYRFYDNSKKNLHSSQVNRQKDDLPTSITADLWACELEPNSAQLARLE